MNSQIPCPECSQRIAIDTTLLLAGSSFSCKQCDISISIAGESKPDVQKAINGFEELKVMSANVSESAQRAL